ncbi:hypothetical protein F4703DRAFT_1298573 [Phycomyces blakesleeanus]
MVWTWILRPSTYNLPGLIWTIRILTCNLPDSTWIIRMLTCNLPDSTWITQMLTCIPRSITHWISRDVRLVPQDPVLVLVSSLQSHSSKPRVLPHSEKLRVVKGLLLQLSRDTCVLTLQSTNSRRPPTFLRLYSNRIEYNFLFYFISFILFLYRNINISRLLFHIFHIHISINFLFFIFYNNNIMILIKKKGSSSY